MLVHRFDGEFVSLKTCADSSVTSIWQSAFQTYKLFRRLVQIQVSLLFDNQHFKLINSSEDMCRFKSVFSLAISMVPIGLMLIPFNPHQCDKNLPNLCKYAIYRVR